jgi:GAF domain-containing protein
VFITFLELLNETLTAAIVVIAVSMLLYNITRNSRNRVARTSSYVLAFITAVYVCDIFVLLGPTSGTWEAVLRLQWVGIAFLPAAMFHLSDALLETTGLPSRGRRRNVGRLLYAIGLLFLVLVAFTDSVVQTLQRTPVVTIRAAPGFVVYIAYFLVVTLAAFVNVHRARLRCLTRATRRRMGYLQIAILTPPIGIFPFSMLLPPQEEFTLNALIIVNVTNMVVILMLVFLAYPLSFFGSRVPDRVVRRELLRFMLLGPGTGLLALVIILYTDPTTRIFGFSGEGFMPFAVVAVVLLWQWLVDLALPWLEKRLIYSSEDYEHFSKLQTLGERILTRADLLQMLEGVIASICDYLQVNTAFAASFNEGVPEMVTATGAAPKNAWIRDEADSLRELIAHSSSPSEPVIQTWHSYWIVPLYSKRVSSNGANGVNGKPIGIIGIQARSPEPHLTDEELATFRSFVRRAAQALDDMALQTEIYAALEGLLPQINVTRSRAEEVEYKAGRNKQVAAPSLISDREQVIEQVKAALRHYWGGPGLTSSSLLELTAVRAALSENENNPARALRAVLIKAIEKQRPEGERKWWSPEWTIYNILDLRFVQSKKVLDVAEKLTMSEADFYRKQRVAIEAVADTLIEMEQDAVQ